MPGRHFVSLKLGSFSLMLASQQTSCFLPRSCTTGRPHTGFALSLLMPSELSSESCLLCSPHLHLHPAPALRGCLQEDLDHRLAAADAIKFHSYLLCSEPMASPNSKPLKQLGWLTGHTKGRMVKREVGGQEYPGASVSSWEGVKVQQEGLFRVDFFLPLGTQFSRSLRTYGRHWNSAHNNETTRPASVHPFPCPQGF